MPTVVYEAEAARADTLVVMLPGITDAPESFVDAGFVKHLQESWPTADVVIADAHFGYYRSRTFLPRFFADVVEPRASRYDQIWLVGVSLGGFGSLVFSEQHPDLIDGMILLAPFLGEGEVLAQIQAAGGLAAWDPPEDLASIEDDAQRKFTEVWAFLRRYTKSDERPQLPRLYLGWGEDDAMRASSALLAEVLPVEQAVELPGGHAWKVWRPLFDALLARSQSGN